MSSTKPCPTCQGEGQVVVGENRVTRDMASDAGEPSMEGMHYDYDYQPCEDCNGSGVVETDTTPCPTCNGKGKVRETHSTGLHLSTGTVQCSDCKGRGVVEATDEISICSMCNQDGKVFAPNNRWLPCPNPRHSWNSVEATEASSTSTNSPEVSEEELEAALNANPDSIVISRGDGVEVVKHEPMPGQPSLETKDLEYEAYKYGFQVAARCGIGSLSLTEKLDDIEQMYVNLLNINANEAARKRGEKVYAPAEIKQAIQALIERERQAAVREELEDLRKIANGGGSQSFLLSHIDRRLAELGKPNDTHPS